MIELIAQAGLIYLAVGIAVTYVAGLQDYLDCVLRLYVRRHGRLPGIGFVALALAMAVLMWPRTFLALAGLRRGV